MKLGDKVIVNAVLYRTLEGEYRLWKEGKIQPRDGIYIGARTLSNGLTWYCPDGITYDRKESVKALLVVFSERENPVYTTEAHVVLKEETNG